MCPGSSAAVNRISGYQSGQSFDASGNRYRQSFGRGTQTDRSTGPIDRAEELSRRIESLPEFSDEREAISAIFADMHELPFDGEGRIMLPPELCEHAQIVLEGSAAFVGHGSTFQIWEPARFERHQQERRSRARGITLPPRSDGGAR